MTAMTAARKDLMRWVQAMHSVRATDGFPLRDIQWLERHGFLIACENDSAADSENSLGDKWWICSPQGRQV